ncbi:MAG: sialidase family protein [Planctomycetota bacterium]|jgi:sialidase-1|nr:sialidase family protein [Planctomycetota bacterium]
MTTLGDGLELMAVAPHGPGNPRNDTATVLELDSGASGALLCAYHAYQVSEQHSSDYGYSEGMLRRSSDGGRSWSAPAVVVRPDAGDQNVHGCAVARAADGALLLLALVCHSPASGTMRCYRSSDAGGSWQRGADVWQGSAGQWLQGGAASLVVLDDGRLLVPFHGGDGDQGTQHNRVGVAWSDDHGLSWQRRDGVLDLPLRGAMEPSVACCADGSLLMSIRSQLGSVLLARSCDRGLSWGAVWTSGLQASESCTCLRRMPGSHGLLLLWNDCAYQPDHHHFGERNALSAALSWDHGASWIRCGDLLREVDHEYTNLGCTMLADGTAYITWMQTAPAFNRSWTDLNAARLELTTLKEVL